MNNGMQCSVQSILELILEPSVFFGPMNSMISAQPGPYFGNVAAADLSLASFRCARDEDDDDEDEDEDEDEDDVDDDDEEEDDDFDDDFDDDEEEDDDFDDDDDDEDDFDDDDDD
jgi:hypothetical protein